MEVILKEDMDNLGKSGEVVNVKDCYWRNYLLPRGLAFLATADDVSRVAHEKRVIAARAAKLSKELQAEADRLGQLTVSIARAVGDEDKLFGSVTSRDIAEALAEQKVSIDAKKIHLEEPLKALGMTEVPIKLGQGVTAKIKVWVVKKE
jgi:large subunit ribosomal protein L9